MIDNIFAISPKLFIEAMSNAGFPARNFAQKIENTLSCAWKEQEDGFSLKLNALGLSPDELHIEGTSEFVKISSVIINKEELGDTNNEKDDKTPKVEGSIFKHNRQILLPKNADPNKITADLSRGVLTIYVKKLPEQKAKVISINEIV